MATTYDTCSRQVGKETCGGVRAANHGGTPDTGGHGGRLDGKTYADE